MFWAIVAGIIAALVGMTIYLLRGEDLRRYDLAVPEPRTGAAASSAELAAVIASLGELTTVPAGTSHRQRLALQRTRLDALGDDVRFAGTIAPTRPDQPSGEWVIAPRADASRRLLYLHGGAWTMGSPRSHRAITTRLAEIIGGTVLSLDYRLMPEYRRRAGLQDCCRAYRWLIEHGPEGPHAADRLFVAGDSAGGNLVLAVLAWARDQRLRQPDAAVALSPVTDCSFSSPSLVDNIATDPMLGPLFGHLARLPTWLKVWIAAASHQAHPRDPAVSPIYGDLSRLPPLLIQASEAEMLIDDARRYANKALASASPVVLQTWPDMVHVWPIFADRLPQGREAFAAIADFLQRGTARQRL